jgi:antitoxin component HigA of HigAB toxin-antitoxin module
MASRSIPNEVEQFLLAVIDTAARIYVDNPQAESVLDDLTRRKLISRVQQSPPKYQFLAASPAETELLHKVAHAYRTQLVQVARFIHSKPSASVRDFARAFRLKDRD